MKKKSSATKEIKLRPFSSGLLDRPHRAAARSMLYPVGFTDGDFQKLILGITSTWSTSHFEKLALERENGQKLGATGFNQGSRPR